jgi:hypothetical protein
VSQGARQEFSLSRLVRDGELQDFVSRVDLLSSSFYSWNQSFVVFFLCCESSGSESRNSQWCPIDFGFRSCGLLLSAPARITLFLGS